MGSLEESCPGAWPASEGARSVELLARARSGDDAALNELVARYQGRLLRIVRIRLGAGRAGLRRFLESSDVVQDTWRKALAGIRDLRVEGDAELLNWLARVATNEIRDQLDRVQAQRRALEREEPLASTPSRDPADARSGPAARAERAEVAEILDAAIAELPAEHREAILLRDYCGADWPSIAARLGRESVHAAQQLHQRAWIRVRQAAERRLGGAGA